MKFGCVFSHQKDPTNSSKSEVQRVFGETTLILPQRIHGTGIFPYIWLICMVHASKYIIHIWLCSKIPLSAKRVAWEVWFGGMIRSMFRRYDSGYDSPHLLYCLHKDYILYQRALSYTKLATGVVFWRGRLGHGTAKRGLGMIRGMYRVWFAVWLGQETVSAKMQ